MSDIPPVYDDDCLACFDPGKTPKYVYARFSGLRKCVPDLVPVCATPPNDHSFKLTQHPDDPCYYNYMGPNWMVWYHFGWGVPARSRLDLWDTLGRGYFLGFEDACAPEGTVFNNTAICGPVGACCSGGFGVVIWTSITSELLAAINLEKADDLFMEMRPLMDGNLVYKFCRLSDATNIAIELEPD